MNKITGDITKMAAQVPALFETLSGMPLSELLGKVRQIGDKAPKPPVGMRRSKGLRCFMWGRALSPVPPSAAGAERWSGV